MEDNIVLLFVVDYYHFLLKHQYLTFKNDPCKNMHKQCYHLYPHGVANASCSVEMQATIMECSLLRLAAASKSYGILNSLVKKKKGKAQVMELRIDY